MLTAWAGLSLALGAFLAGLVLSESEYAHQMFAEVVPFRDTLSSLFFVSVGMLLDLRFVIGHPLIVVSMVVGVLLAKLLAGGLPTLLVGYPTRVAVLTGAALLQVGEFSFVLANRGQQVGLLDREAYQTFLAAAVITMVLTPFAIALAPRLAELISKSTPLGRWSTSRRDEELHPASGANRRGHVIIVGFGLGGQNLARVLRSVEIPYVILELNPESVRRSHAHGEPIYFGDCTWRSAGKAAS